MNGPTRKKVYDYLAKRDGEYCKCCGILSVEKQLVIDHKDNDNSNNFSNNFQLLCRRCNYLKNPRQPVDECVSENIREDISELQTSQTKKPLFKKFVWHEINERVEIPEKDILDSSAEELDISQVTAKRWLDAMCSSRGLLEKITRVRTRVVRLKTKDMLL